MSNLWKIVERIEDITDHLQDINDYLDQIHDTHEAYNDWIVVATDGLMKLQKEVNFIKNKKTCI